MNGRLLLAIILAPLCAPLVSIALNLLFSGYPYSAPGHFEKYVRIAGFELVSGYLAGLILGGPAALVLYRYGSLTLSSCLLVAAVLGGLSGIAIAILSGGLWPASAVAILGGLAAIAAMLDALAFSLLAGLPWRKTYKFRNQTAG